MPPFGFFPALAISFPVLVWLLDGASAAGGGWRTIWAAAKTGWWFAFGYHLAGLWWIGAAFLVEADRFAWALPIAVVALPAGLALFTALGTAVARLLWRPGAGRILALALGLGLAEYGRGTVLTGFPWNLYGYALTQYLWLAQAASLVGVYGLTLVAILVFASPSVLGDDPDDAAGRAFVPAGAILVLMCLGLYGGWRVSTTPVGMVEGVRLRIVQPDIPQDARFRPEERDTILARYLELSDKASSPERMGVRDVTHLIWPESAFPFFLIRDRAALAQIANLLPPGTTLLTGAARPEAPAPGRSDIRVYNSVYMIDDAGQITETYDKVHLVPFGEYLPFQDRLESMGLEAVTRVRGGFSAGDRRRTLTVPGAPPVGILICYEIIFPGEATSGDRRPGWLLNVTNDAWFGFTPGPYQHMHQAQVRAVEEGLPIVRAANNGISAVIDPLGRVLRMLPLGARDSLDADLPTALAPTPFARAGHVPLAVVFFGLFLILARPARRRSLG
ncbi:apolipoprotein N-acyltransferase [Phreatobacter aquaticus]|uniref:Apolipoprotein N-acyltransferase n=2 Tax=Phreatobacter aquaticus TaxID=2570229 RepID=A0A4D7QTE7_9HYPH|nr:apolipoprotein N-acyltransferase [Phreatobacter aquaticus]